MLDWVPVNHSSLMYLQGRCSAVDSRSKVRHDTNGTSCERRLCVCCVCCVLENPYRVSCWTTHSSLLLLSRSLTLSTIPPAEEVEVEVAAPAASLSLFSTIARISASSLHA